MPKTTKKTVRVEEKEEVPETSSVQEIASADTMIQEVETQPRTTPETTEEPSTKNENSIMQFLIQMEKNMKDNSQELKNNIGELEKNMGENINNLEKNIKDNSQELKDNINNLEKNMGENMTALEKNMEEKLTNNISNLEKNMGEQLNQNMSEIKKELEDHAKKIEEVKENMEQLKSEIWNHVEEENTKTKEEIKQSSENFQKAILFENGEFRKAISTELTNEIVEVNEKIDGHIEKTNEEFRNVENSFEKVKQNLNEVYLEIQGGVRTTYIPGNEQTLTFTGNVDELHQKIYLERMMNKIRNIRSFTDIKEIIRSTLKGSASLWFATKANELISFEQFADRFSAYYWGEHTQVIVREKLYFGKYSKEKNGTHTEHALRMYDLVQYLDPPMKEEDIVLTIARHFNAEVTETVRLQNLITLDRFLQYLSKVERNTRLQN